MRKGNKIIPPAPRKHARLGPSGFKSREICPSYIPTQGESAASKMGTKLHDLLERFGINVLEEQEFQFLDTGEQMTMLEKIADYVTPFEKVATKIHREVELDLTSYNLKNCEFGTADLILEHGHDHLHLMDYKFGKLEVDDAEVNIQGWIYVLGAFVRHPKAKFINLHLLQPARDEIGTATFRRDDIPRMLLRAQTIADRVVQRAGKDFNVVVDNCLWCNNKAGCRALHDMALMVNKHASLHVPTQGFRPEELDDATILVESGSDIYDLAKLMEGWSDQMKRKITNLSQEGWEIKGKRLRTVGGKSSIKLINEAVDMVVERTGQTKEEVLAAVADVSITKAENYVAAYASRGDKGKAKDELRAAMAAAGLIYVGSPSAYLVDEKKST